MFSSFYNSLSSDGVFFFWIAMFLLVFLVFLTIILLIKNNKLTKLLKEREEADTLPIAEDNVKKEVTTVLRKEPANSVVKEEIKKEDVKPIENKIEEKKINTENEKVGLYQKNVLREANSRGQTSPIHIENNNSNNDEDMLLGLDYGEDSISPLEEMEDLYEVNEDMKFASEIVDKMEKESTPNNIELTEYEKKQEEEAIISYDELLKVKDKIYNITEDEETDEFIDELKSFRLDLQ